MIALNNIFILLSACAVFLAFAALIKKILEKEVEYLRKKLDEEKTKKDVPAQIAEAAKKDLVRAFLKAHRPRRVIDLGCNTGQYSRLAADCGARVVAVDQSHDAVELLYRQLREKPAPIVPMVVDLTNPSPGVGFRNRERPGFFKRVKGDCVLALALVHHLLVDGNLSLCAIRDQLADLTRRDLVVEYIPPGDPMFQRLVAARRQRFEEITLERFRETFAQRFELLGLERLPNSMRSLFFLRKCG